MNLFMAFTVYLPNFELGLSGLSRGTGKVVSWRLKKPMTTVWHEILKLLNANAGRSHHNTESARIRF